jgi:hypothetical protein
MDTIHSTANYALASILGHVAGDRDLQRAALEAMLRYFVTDPDSPVRGSFADVLTNEAWAFDNLYALIALQFAEQAGVIIY